MTQSKNRTAVYAGLVLICIAIAALTIRDYRMAFHTDTYVHALFLPKIMVSEGKFLLDNFPYSNADNRTIAIAAVHFLPTAIFPDHPWMSYFIGSLILSALFILAAARAGMKLNAPLIVMLPLLIYLSVSPSFDFYEHIHGQNSYVIEQAITLVVLTALATYLAKHKVSQAPSAKPLWRFFLPAAVCLVIAGATGINRTLVTLYAPLLFAFVGCRVLMLGKGPILNTPRFKADMKALGILLAAIILGVIVFKIIAGQIYYTRGAARPLKLENWPGQLDTLKQIAGAFQRLTYWGVPSGSALTSLRNIAGILIVLYVAGRSIFAILKRTSPVQIMITLYMAGVAGALALAFNLTDIRPEPRYMLPFMTAVIFAVILFVAEGQKWEKFLTSGCMTILALAAIGSAMDRHSSVIQSQKLHTQIRNIFTETGTEAGLTHMAGAGMINLGLGIGDFIPIKMNPDGNISSLPFHTDFYYRDYMPAKQTGLVYVTSHPRDGVPDAVINTFLSENDFQVIRNEIIMNKSERIRVIIVEGDLRSVFPGHPRLETPARRLVSEKSKFKNGVPAPGDQCSTHIYVPPGHKGFSVAESAFMVSPGSYEFKPVFDNDPPDPNTLVMSLTTDQEKALYRGTWKSDDAITFDVKKMGLLRIVLAGKNASGFKYCGAEISRISGPE